MKYKVTISKDENGYYLASTPSLPNFTAKATSRTEAIEKLKRIIIDSKKSINNNLEYIEEIVEVDLAENSNKSKSIKKNILAFIIFWVSLFFLHHLDIVTFPFFGKQKIFSSKKTVYTNPASTIEFCESVDNNLNCINKNDVFYPGTVFIKILSNTPFNDDYIYLTIYSITGKSESLIDKSSLEVNPDWGIFCFSYYFDVSGNYKVVARNFNNKKIAEGIVSIK